MIAIDHSFAVEFDAVDGSWARPRIEDDVCALKADFLAVLIERDFNGIFRCQLAATDERIDFVFFVEKILKTLVLAIYDLFRPSHRGPVVERRLALEFHAILGGVLGEVKDAG